MQYYLNGFHPGDPVMSPSRAGHAGILRPDLPDEVDVLIVGCGPAGLVLAAQLAGFPSITTRIIERKPGPLQLGQADGIACRTVEMFEAFGLADQLLNEAYWVNETAFWHPDPAAGGITRTGRVQDTADDLSEFPHVIVNQARIHDYLLRSMQRSQTHLSPEYSLDFRALTVDPTADYPVTVTLHDELADAPLTIRARYVVGCDGARSKVRKSIGRELHGTTANHAWGVMDILPLTDFPDIRFKSAIQSADAGNILLIPREGGYLVRLYVDLGEVTEASRTVVHAMTAEDVLAVANRVLQPYSIEAAETVWFSIYEVAQRVTDAFDDTAGRGGDPHVFIAGDACHTHSAKAGQGMNVSMQDAFNLGWKLAAVLRGLSDQTLLHTYSSERHPIAQELIAFDREWSAMMASAPDPAHGGVGSEELEQYYVEHGRFTAGVATRYRLSPLTDSDAAQSLATGLEIGTRFHSAPVTRVADGRQVELGHAARADGRWRLYLFAGQDEEEVFELCRWLTEAPTSPIVRHTPQRADIDDVIDVRAVFQRSHDDVELGALPRLLLPRKGRLGLTDYEKTFSAVTKLARDIYAARGLDRTTGCMVVVRPDQYISTVLRLQDRDELAEFFDSVLLPQR